MYPMVFNRLRVPCACWHIVATWTRTKIQSTHSQTDMEPQGNQQTRLLHPKGHRITEGWISSREKNHSPGGSVRAHIPASLHGSVPVPRARLHLTDLLWVTVYPGLMAVPGHSPGLGPLLGKGLPPFSLPPTRSSPGHTHLLCFNLIRKLSPAELLGHTLSVGWREHR